MVIMTNQVSIIVVYVFVLLFLVLTQITSSIYRPHLYHYPPLSQHYRSSNTLNNHHYRQQHDDEVDFSFSQEEYGHSSNEDAAIGAADRGQDQDGDQQQSDLPEFVSQVPNVTVQIGREARLPCIVRNLATYRTAWIRDEEKSILTLQRQMVTRDPRIQLQEESQIDGSTGGGEFGGFGAEPFNKIRYFILVIRNVQFSDRGGYMCQVNTVPMKSQIGYLHVVVPPDIIDHESSNDVMVREGDNVTLKCKARGHPEPEIEWRREDGARVPLGDRNGGNRRVMVNKTEGELLEITRVTRVHSGAWLCIASNGVMPSVSRRILLNVQFAPQIWIPIEEIGAPFGSNITLDCHIEAYPLPLNYWTFGVHAESIYISGPKYEVSVKEKGYKRHLKLTIQKLSQDDLGLYKCHAQNSLGRQVKQVKIYVSEIHQQKSQSKQNQQHHQQRRQQASITQTTRNLSLSSSSNDNYNNNGGSGRQKKMKKKRKRKKTNNTNTTINKDKLFRLDQNDNDELMMTNNTFSSSNNKNQREIWKKLTTSNSSGGLLYSVINSFEKKFSMSSTKASKNSPTIYNGKVVDDDGDDDEFEFYDDDLLDEDDEEFEDDYVDHNHGKSLSSSTQCVASILTFIYLIHFFS